MLKTILLSSVACMSLFSMQTPKEKDTSVQRGKFYGKFDTNATKKSKSKRAINDILEDILKEQKKQTKLQTEIRDILKEAYDPTPQEITVNGKKCLANSSAECFKMPLIPEAKRVPVLAEMMNKPTVENAVKYQQWMARWFMQVNNIAQAQQLSLAQYGDKAYPLSYNSAGFTDARGHDGVVRHKFYTKLLNAYGDKFSLVLFLGSNLDSDAYGLNVYNSVREALPNVPFTVIYFNEKVKSSLKETFKHVYAGKLIKEAKTLSDEEQSKAPQLFKQFGIYATPALVVVTKFDNKSQVVSVGKQSKDDILSRIVRTLKYKKVFPENVATDYKVWQNTTFIKSYMKDTHNEDINLTKVDYSNELKGEEDE